MPLRGDKPDLWHWTQAVAWIAFDDANSEKGDLFEIAYRHRKGGSDFGASVLKPAIRELCDCTGRGKITPKWQYEPGYNPNFGGADMAHAAFRKKIDETKDAMLCRALNYEGAPAIWRTIERLHFSREEILSIWPADSEPLHQPQPSNPINSAKSPRKIPPKAEESKWTEALIAELRAEQQIIGQDDWRTRFEAQFPDAPVKHILKKFGKLPPDVRRAARRPRKAE